jgi:hypothetical protein
MNRFLILALFLILIACSAKENWTTLFNGKDFSGWDTWLATPHRSYDIPGVERDSAGNYSKPLGLNNDPLKVFSVSEEDGKGVIHISGQGWGALTSRDEFENFHLSLEYKWGEKKWAPRDSTKRDSGVLYYCVGEHNTGSDAWLQSQECQVQEGDTGDYWSVAGAIADVSSEKVLFNGEEILQYKEGAPKQTIGKNFDGTHWNTLRCLKSMTNEKPHGEWNKIDVYAYGGKSVHVVNGKVVMVIENSRRIVDGKEVPLTKGKIQLQSEGAEVFYKDVKVRQISAIPTNL